MSAGITLAFRVLALLAVSVTNAVLATLVASAARGGRDKAGSLREVARLLRKEGRVPHGAGGAYATVPALVLVASFVSLSPLAFAGYAGFGVPGAGMLVTLAALALLAASLSLVAGSADGVRERSEAVRAAVSRAAWAVAMGLSLLTPVMIAGSLDAPAIVDAQRGAWLFGLLPRWFALSPHIVAFAIFALSAYMFVAPMLDAEDAAQAGTAAYAGPRMAALRLASWTAVFAVCALAVTVFFGGWLVPYVDRAPLAEALGVLVFAAKTYGLLYAVARVRAARPRVALARPVSLVWTRVVPASLLWLAVYAALSRGGGL